MLAAKSRGESRAFLVADAASVQPQRLQVARAPQALLEHLARSAADGVAAQIQRVQQRHALQKARERCQCCILDSAVPYDDVPQAATCLQAAGELRGANVAQA